MVTFEKRGKKIGILIRDSHFPGESLRHTYEMPFSKELKKQYERTIGKEVKKLVDHCDWKQLLEFFPDIEQFRRLVPGSETTVNDLLRLVLKYWEEQGVKSFEDKSYKVAAVREEFGGERLASKVTALDIDAYKRRLFEAGYAAATVKHRLMTLQTAFNEGLKKKLVTEVPYFDMPKVENEDDEGAYFEDEEIEALIQKLPDHLKGLVRIAHITGWRVSELISRRQKDVHEMFLHLDKEHSKNGEERDFPLNIPGIREALAAQATYIRSLGRITPWLFPTPLGEPARRFDKSWDTAVLASGISVENEDGSERRRLFRHLRNTAITNLLDMGVPVHMCQNLVGHKTIVMQGRYHQRRKRKMLEIGERVTALVEAAQAQSAAKVSQIRPKVDVSGTELSGAKVEKASNFGGFSGGQEWN